MSTGEYLVEYLTSESSTTPIQKVFPSQQEGVLFAESIGNLYLSGYVLDGHENATVNEE